MMPATRLWKSPDRAGISSSVMSPINSLADNVEDINLHEGAAIAAKGNSLGNLIDGNANDNDLWGFDGNDTLIGGEGKDSMTGGAGDDSYYIRDIADEVTEQADEGDDTLVSSLGFTSIDSYNVNIENLTLSAFSAITGVGNALGQQDHRQFRRQ